MLDVDPDDEVDFHDPSFLLDGRTLLLHAHPQPEKEGLRIVLLSQVLAPPARLLLTSVRLGRATIPTILVAKRRTVCRLVWILLSLP